RPAALPAGLLSDRAALPADRPRRLGRRSRHQGPARHQGRCRQHRQALRELARPRPGDRPKNPSPATRERGLFDHGDGQASMRRLSLFVGAWELGGLAVMILLSLVGLYLTPRFWGNPASISATLRDAAQFGVMAVGSTFVLVNKDLDLSVGSVLGLTATVFSKLYAPGFYDTSPWFALVVCLAMGAGIGLLNGALVTYLRVP